MVYRNVPDHVDWRMNMRKFWFFLAILVLAGLAGLAVFLNYWDIPPPKGQIETTVPDDRFPK